MKISNYGRVFMFLASDVADPENEFSYAMENAVDSNNCVENSDEFIEFINAGLMDNDESDVCFMLKDAKDRILDCGLGSYFANQTEVNNSYLNFF